MAVNGCPRNCAESCTKDIGIVGNDGGWEIFVGGNGGTKARLADSFCKVKTDEELIEICGALMQYYRETGKYLERTSEWVERLGLEQIRAAVLDDAKQRKELVERIELALQQVEDPWKKVLNDDKLRNTLFQDAKTGRQQVIEGENDSPLGCLIIESLWLGLDRNLNNRSGGCTLWKPELILR
ncbi:nitrite reductase subunit NirD [Actinobacillus pleuropneumoniae]|nr:nitrite reductase subunit NirD [Actinobacillus pleuropneumoniae]